MRVLVITGAGVSAESGISTFRGKNGYWRNLDPAKLATPEAFAKNPKLVWEWYRERKQRIRAAQPNPAHQAIVKLAAHANEFLLVTQNVDDLHLRAESEGHLLSRDKSSRFTAIFLRLDARTADVVGTSKKKRIKIFRDAPSVLN